MSKTITSDNFNASKLSVSAIKINEKTGAKSCYLNYEGGRVLVQTAIELRSPFGLNTFTGMAGEKADNPDYSVDLSLDGYLTEGTDAANYYNMIRGFEEYVVKEGVKNGLTWFKDDDLTERDVSKKFISTVKFQKDKVTGKPKDYPPTQKVKLNLTGKPEMCTKFYDENGRQLTKPAKELLGKGARLTCILQCGGVWFTGTTQFGLTWRVTQVVVHSSGEAAPADFAFVGFKRAAAGAGGGGGAAAAAVIENTIDDAEEEAALGSAAAAMMPSQHNPMADVEVPEGDGEEVEPQIVPKKPITKKKLTIGKK
jgi:hypothetical protein